MPLNILDSQAFCTIIKSKLKGNDQSVLNAITEYCEETELDPEIAATLIDADLYSRIQQEAQNLHLIEPIQTLPFDA